MLKMNPHWLKSSPLPTRLVLIVSVLTLLSKASMAQVPTPTPVDPLDAEITRLEKQVKISTLEKTQAENEKAIAENRKAALKAQIPESSITALEGKTTLNDKALLEATLLSQRALSQAGAAVAADIAQYNNSQTTAPTPQPVKQIAIYNEADAKALGNFDVFLEQIKYLDSRYNDVLQVAGAPITPSSEYTSARSALLGTALGAQAVSGTLKSVVDMLSLFRTETTINGVDVAADDKALVVAIARGLQGTAIKLYYPAIMPMQGKSKKGRQVVDFINQLQARRRQAEDLKIQTAKQIVIEQAQKKAAEESLAREKAKPNPDAAIISALQATIDELTPRIEDEQKVVADISALNDTLDKFVTALYKTDDQAAVSALTGLMRAAALNEMLDTGNGGYILFLTIHKMGGNNKIERNLFFTKAKDYYNGGARISYILFDADRSIKLVGSPEVYLDYVRPHAIISR